MDSSGEERLSGKVVLVIEDDAMQLMAMQMLMESWGCSVLPAASAAGAESAIASATQPPAVIISDFRLPDGVSGIEAVARLRGKLGQSVPAVLQTGDTDPALVRQAHDAGYSVLHKPYDPNHLRNLLITLV
jgi:CheY-like chemotaxis protein